MKAQFLVTIEGDWLEDDKPVTAARIEQSVRKAIRDEFEHLATRRTVKRIPVGAHERKAP